LLVYTAWIVSRHAEESDFDNAPDLVNVANGVLHLPTGELAPHHCSQRFTYCLLTRYNPLAKYDWWDQFLLQNVKGGQEVVDYLQEFIGYCLTGYTFEECLLYVFGPTRDKLLTPELVKQTKQAHLDRLDNVGLWLDA
jgi:phage/plasmid-associated DNA primase